jgi:hypothetical protein
MDTEMLRQHLKRLKDQEASAIRDAAIFRRSGADQELMTVRRRMLEISHEIARVESLLRELQTH